MDNRVPHGDQSTSCFVPDEGFWIENISQDRFTIIGYPPFAPGEKRFLDRKALTLYRSPDGFVSMGCVAFAVTYQRIRYWCDAGSGDSRRSIQERP